jgi:hypothetical protein
MLKVMQERQSLDVLFQSSGPVFQLNIALLEELELHLPIPFPESLNFIRCPSQFLLDLYEIGIDLPLLLSAL